MTLSFVVWELRLGLVTDLVILAGMGLVPLLEAVYIPDKVKGMGVDLVFTTVK
jgi:hypothetical protein